MPLLLARGVRYYYPAWMVRLCHLGEVTWLRLPRPAPDDPDRRLAGDTRQLLYGFTLADGHGAIVAEGRATVVLNTPLIHP